MMILLAKHDVRRVPALLLVPSLLLMGVLVTRAPVEADGADGMRAHGGTHAQVARAPQLRAGTSAGSAPAAVLVSAEVVPHERVVGAPGESRLPPPEPRKVPRLSPLSRAPPASL
jgi:hypothetical protein